MFFSGFYASDDIAYLEAARSIGDDGTLSPGLGNARLGITIPSALMWKLSGGSVTAVVWLHVLYHLALVPIAYVLGRLLRDDRAGLIAAALVAINPLFYVYAGAVLPDNAATVWFGLSLIALIATARHTDPGTKLTSFDRRRFLGYFVAGAMVGCCYSCKETALILTVPAAVFIMLAGPSLRSLVWIQNGASFTLGLVTVFVLELVVLRLLTGHWINRLTFIQDATAVLVEYMNQQGTTPFARLGFASEELTRWMPLTTWLLLAGAIAYGFMRVRHLGMMVMFWWLALYLTLGSMSLSMYLPPVIQARYYAFAILPAAVMTAIVASVAIERWKQRQPRAWTGPAVVCAVLLVGGYECGKNLPASGTIYRAPEVRAFSAALEQARERYPKYPVVISPHYANRMAPIVVGRDLTLDRKGGKRPPPPYVYIRFAGHNDIPDPAPIAPAPLRVDVVSEVPATKTRWTVIVDALRRVTSTKVRPKPALANKTRSAELILVRPPAEKN